MRSRVVRSAEGAGQRWHAPSLGGAAAPDALALEQEQRRGFDEGFAQGYQEGLRAAEQEMHQGVARIAALTESLRRPVAMLAQEVDDELVRLTLAIARQVIRRELRTDSDQIAAVVKEARASLASVQGMLRIGVHPDDAPLVRRMFSDEEELAGVQVLEDPNVSRGGCTLATDTSFVDATVETRIARLAVQLLGDERDRDRAGGQGPAAPATHPAADTPRAPESPA